MISPVYLSQIFSKEDFLMKLYYAPYV